MIAQQPDAMQLIYLPALQKRGLEVSLLPTGDRFRVDPIELITPELKQSICKYRDEILKELHIDNMPRQSVDTQTITDPRPDLTDDAAQWMQLLTLARDTNSILHQNGGLHFFRCMGARLRRSTIGGISYHIVYDASRPGGTFNDQADFDKSFTELLRSSNDVVSRVEAELTKLLAQLT